VIQGFFLDRVDAKARCPPVARKDDFSALRLTDVAEAALAFPKSAVMGAQVALHPFIVKPAPPLSAYHIRRDNLSFFHLFLTLIPSTIYYIIRAKSDSLPASMTMFIEPVRFAVIPGIEERARTESRSRPVSSTGISGLLTTRGGLLYIGDGGGVMLY
jgi:hypothetical protein